MTCRRRSSSCRAQLRVLNDQTTFGTLTVTVSEAGTVTKTAAVHHQSGMSKAFHRSLNRFVHGIEAIVGIIGPLLLVAAYRRPRLSGLPRRSTGGSGRQLVARGEPARSVTTGSSVSSSSRSGGRSAAEVTARSALVAPASRGSSVASATTTKAASGWRDRSSASRQSSRPSGNPTSTTTARGSAFDRGDGGEVTGRLHDLAVRKLRAQPGRRSPRCRWHSS